MEPAELIAAALYDDPMFGFIQPDDLRRRKLLAWYVPRVVRRTEAKGRLDVVPDCAAAIWIPPTSTLRPPLISWTSLLVAPGRLGLAALQRAMEFAAAVDEASRDQAPGSWRLMHVAVAPSVRSRGHAAEVLAGTLAEADAGGLRCFVAATSEPAVAFLSTQGFEVAHHLRVEGLPQFWTMMREPRTDPPPRT